jgi:hypothetical protein
VGGAKISSRVGGAAVCAEAPAAIAAKGDAAAPAKYDACEIITGPAQLNSSERRVLGPTWSSFPGHSIDGITRSGGRWPSMKVFTLTMTFSPMSMRPSTVAEPMWGSSTTLGSFSSLGLIAGSCS